MTIPPPLPRFRKPPVSEVAVGIQFSGPTLTPVHLGLYYQRVKARFPKVQVQPPLAPAIETFGPPTVVSFSVPPIGSPRVWFVSNDDEFLIQLQAGRLFFNWRATSDRSAYPHFEAVRQQFMHALDELDSLISSEGLGQLSANQCEVVYVNPLPNASTCVPISAPESIFRNWSAQLGPEWNEPLEDIAFNIRYRFDDEDGKPFGRLTVTLSSGWGPDGSSGFSLELTARGMPRGEGHEGIVAFHDYAHEAIVRCFTGLTTRAMHERWERFQ